MYKRQELGSIDWFPAQGEGIGAYDSFHAAATALTLDDFPEIVSLDDGGIFAMRLEEILPPRPAPFEESQENVQANWEAAQTEEVLTAQAEAVRPALEAGESFAEQGLDSIVETDQERGAFVQGTPPAFMPAVFEMEPGEVRIVSGFGAILVVRLDAIHSVEENDEVAAETTQLSREIGQSVATELFNLFSDDVVLRSGSQINQQALDTVHVNFP